MAAAAKSGAGSAARSSLPAGVSGSRSTAVKADGTMCEGSEAARKPRSSAGAGTVAPGAATA
ncbi:hypothetical protein ACFQVA_21715 [Actinomadura keratinilytica]